MRSLALGLLVLSVVVTVTNGQAPVSAVTIDTGIVYLYGNYVPPPYTLERGDSSISLNGVQIWPHLTFSEPLPPPPAPDPGIAKIHELNVQAGALRRQLAAEGRGHEVRTALADFYRASGLVDSVLPGSNELCVYFKKELHAAPLEVSLGKPTGSIPFAVQLEDNFRGFESSLRRGAIVVVGTHGNLFVQPLPAGPFNAALEELRSAANATAKPTPETWKGKFLTVNMAAELKSPRALPSGRR